MWFHSFGMSWNLMCSSSGHGSWMPGYSASVLLQAWTDSQHCFKAKHAFHRAFACFKWLSAPLYFALRHVVFRFVFLASVSATRNKTRKHEMQRVVSKRVVCLPSDINLSLILHITFYFYCLPVFMITSVAFYLYKFLCTLI
jgi:hypothetical protein